MGRFSREKGKRGEREVAKLFSDFGLPARRTAQYCGRNNDSSDVKVEDLPQLYVECKLGYSKQIHDWFERAFEDAGADMIPIIFHKCDHGRWLATVDAAWLIGWISSEHNRTKG